MNYDYASFRQLGLLPYQAAFAAHSSRFKIGLWARQTGKDHTATAEAVLDCLQNPGAAWIIVAASERQALESLAKAKEWARTADLPIHEYIETPANVPCSVARTSSTEIKWSNGSRLLAVPANPSTIRGYSANLILTEFAFHENTEALWRAIYPTISNPLRGGVKKLRIISTPNGLTNKFAQLWHTALPANLIKPPVFPSENNQSSIIHNQFTPSPSANNQSSIINNQFFHRSRITIHDAIADGLPLDAAELQAGLNDPEAWSQEYLCEFMDNSTVLLPYDLIESCESDLATELSSPQSLTASAFPTGQRPQLFAGLDFARKNHLTVCWILERLPSNLLADVSRLPPPTRNAAFQSAVPPICNRHQPTQSPNNQSSIIHNQFLYLTREVLCLRNASTPEQLELLLPRLNLCQRIALDYTGPGIGLGDFLHRELGGGGRARPPGAPSSGRLELCPFTTSFKAELFPRLAAAFESRELLIPIGRDLREDLHSIYRTTSHSGNTLYRAHSTPDGHADRTTALALALRAAQTAPAPGGVTSVGRKFPLYSGRSGRSSRGSRYLPAPHILAVIH